ncbi:tetratricopeptide repeat protein [Streptomyces sp. HNM0575]|uniref:ATP-binding protein n=1 Tax=Streptomyces sp. HNM0575 TaxID=2716338 RepID=UPI0019D02CF2|nr:tetratricopeptide repeat protein [Streptomyces sp. HNM0575]
MIAHRPLNTSPAGRDLHQLVCARFEPEEESARQWDEACRAPDPLPALLQLSGFLARYAAADAVFRAELDAWLQHHQAVLHETNNSIAGSAHVHGPSLQAGSIHGDVHVHHAELAALRQKLVPRQLRPAPAHFTNRAAELLALDRITGSHQENRPVLAVISGPGGVGKTTLALRWLHDVADRYPDGQLYVDLASDPAGVPEPTDSVLGGFLRALGVEGGKVPAEAEEAASLFRSITARSRLSILLDNAVSAAQVRSLLPSSAMSTVVVTTRWRLGGLARDGAEFLPVTPLPKQAGRELLTSTVGKRRTSAEAEAVAGLVRLCAGLPLALSIVGARLVMRPQWSIARVERELKDEQRRLQGLAMEDVSILSVFDFSYDGLPPDAARAYRWLGLHPGPDLALEAAAAALELPEDDAIALLESLVDASVLEPGGSGRYRFHDLIRLHARQRAETRDGATARDGVIQRLLEYHLALATEVDHVVTPLEWQLGPVHRAADSRTTFRTGREALKVLEGELPNLMALMRAGHERHFDSLVWQLAEAMWSFFLHRKHFPDWMAAYRLGIKAASRCADPAALSRMHHHLGFAFHNLGRREEALEQGLSSLDSAREARHERAETEALGLVGMAYRSQGRFDEAVGVLRQAVALDHRAERVRGEALGRRRLGQALLAAGRTYEAIDQLVRGRDLAESLSDQKVKAMTMVWLADAYRRAGRAGEAVTIARAAWPLIDDSGSSQYRAQVLMVWGEAAEALGELATAHGLIGRSRGFYRQAGAPDLGRVDRALARIEAQQSSPPGSSPS